MIEIENKLNELGIKLYLQKDLSAQLCRQMLSFDNRNAYSNLKCSFITFETSVKDIESLLSTNNHKTIFEMTEI